MDSQDWRPIESFRTDPDVIFKEIHGYWPPLNTQVRRYFRTYQLEFISVALSIIILMYIALTLTF